jgi:hypothetical protein
VGDRRLIENYYADYYNLIDILCKLTNNYRLLIGGAAEINQITLAHKKDVRKALKRVRIVGDMIDDILAILEKSEINYFDYCRIKADVVKEKLEYEYVKSEIEGLISLNDEEKKV